MGDQLIRRIPGFQPILYKFIVWAYLGLSPYLYKCWSPNYDLTHAIMWKDKICIYFNLEVFFI